MAADPDDKHMPASVRTAYRCEKDPTGDLNRDSLINHINEVALNTPDKEEKVKFEPGAKRGKVYVPVYNEAQLAAQEKEDEGQVRLDPEMEEALSNATMKDIMELADILNTNPQVTIEFIWEKKSKICINRTLWWKPMLTHSSILSPTRVTMWSLRRWSLGRSFPSKFRLILAIIFSYQLWHA